MTVRVSLIAPAMNAALREARFDDAGPVELPPTGLDPLCLAAGVRVVGSPSGRCRATAEALGLSDAYEVEPALAGCAMGRWRGRRLDELTAEEPESVTRWLSDPGAAPHGGESLRELRARVAEWMEGLQGLEGLESGTWWAVAEPDVIRTAVAHALGAPEEVFWRLDVRPLSRTTLSGRAGRWNLLFDGRIS
ncbi:histidine phosphatase family protein [Streptomyces sp. NPDC048623]|uniref:histidine phosphatase family protein n=1 Tax=Streptomyces sp. NPDC048623 TaxID=3155761 RepID=UPI003421352B